ncbi:MAG: NUDIX domain-containing protein [Candidatus Dadabacteria bacterium]|nr:NUDIX domain-containing protein [Candidatus Dadabacteria bacterium]
MKDKIINLKKSLIPLEEELLPDSNVVLSSVLMMLSHKNDELGIYFIKRAEHPDDKFSGHIAFPGGKKKKIDNSLLDTAIRETIEEVDVDIVKSGEVLGKLDIVNPYTPSVSHYIVRPFVSILHEEVDFYKNYEVEDIFWIPISHLLDERNRNIRIRESEGEIINDYIFNYNQYIIWGLTGRILQQFLDKVSDIF